jgi:hypothetical protein
VANRNWEEGVGVAGRTGTTWSSGWRVGLAVSLLGGGGLGLQAAAWERRHGRAIRVGSAHGWWWREPAGAVTARTCGCTREVWLAGVALVTGRRRWQGGCDRRPRLGGGHLMGEEERENSRVGRYHILRAKMECSIIPKERVHICWLGVEPPPHTRPSMIPKGRVHICWLGVEPPLHTRPNESTHTQPIPEINSSFPQKGTFQHSKG